jgi:RNA polymerase sigma factor (sigma-70 family)
MSASSAIVSAMYQAHHEHLRRSAWRICRDDATAEDLVQEAFTRLIVEVNAGRTPENVPAWLSRVISNAAISLARKAATGHQYAPMVAMRGTGETPEAAVLEHELRTEVDALLAGVRPDTRTALVLAASGYTGGEIARTIGRTPLATRALMCRARARLREQLNASAPHPHGHLEPVA